MKNSTLKNLALLKDPKFYLENLVKIKGKKPGQLIPFILKEHQKDLFNTIKNYSRIIVLKARQLGTSTAIVGNFYHRTIMNPGTTSAIIGYNTQLTAELLDKIKTFYRSTPDELKPTIHYDSKWEISFPRIDSKILVLPSTENVGRGYTISNCVSGETEIFIKNGFTKKVKDVFNGEFIVNGKGGLAKVQKVIKRKNNKKLLKISIIGNDDLIVTEDHKILVRGSRKDGFRPMWKEAKDLTNKDRIGYPYFQCRNRYKKIIIPNAIDKNYLSRSSFSTTSREIDINYNFGLFIGWYLAEGSIRKQRDCTYTGVDISVDKSEVAEILEVIDNSVRKNVQKISVSYNKNSRTAIIHLYGKNFAKFISEKFGDGCSNKMINDCVWYWGWKFGYGLLYGLFKGDGYFKNKYKVQLTSVSKQLIYQTKKLLISLRIGMPGIRHKDTNRYGIKTKHRYDLQLDGKFNYKFRRKFGLQLPVYNNGRAMWKLKHLPGANQGHGSARRGRFYFWSKIIKIEESEYEEYVYDIMMEKEPHSFLTKSGVVHNCHVTELQGWENQEEKMMTLEAAVPINGKLIVEGTPLGIGNYFYRLWMGDNDYVKKEYGWWVGYSREEIEIIKRRMNNPMKFAQEYGLTFLSSGLAVFDIKKIIEHKKNILKVGDTVKDGDQVYKVEEIDGWRIYKKPKPDHFYVAGADVAEGLEGGDYSVAVIWDRTTGEEVAFYRRYIPADTFGKKLNEMGRVYNNALMVVEINNHGLTTITTLKNLLYPSFYFRPVKIETMGQSTGERLGWKTTRVTRPILIDDFDKAFRENVLTIHSKELLDEMTVFVYDKNGDMNPQHGFTDDCIFAGAIGLQGFKIMSSTKLEQLDYSQYLPRSFAY